MESLKAFLDGLDPRAWYLVISGFIFLLTWLWRRFLPNVWAAAVAKSPVLPQFWMTVLGALVSAGPALGHGIAKVVEETVLGGIFAAIGAQGLHAMFRALPGPYDGAHQQVAAAFVRRNTPPGGLHKLDFPPPATKG